MADAPARFKDLCLDANDHHALADWWCAAIGYVRRDSLDDAATSEADEPRPHDWPIPIVDPAGAGPLMWIVPVIRLQVPPLSQERRKQLAARAKETAEETRVAIRNVRRDANKHADGIAKGMSEDDLKRLKDEIQALTKQYEEKVDGSLEAKTKELTTL